MRLTTLRPMLCIALLGACCQAAAVESRQMGPDGSGACPDAAATPADRADDQDATDEAAAAQAHRSPQKTKPAVSASPRASGGGRSTPPRFHSFLPGMFR